MTIGKVSGRVSSVEQLSFLGGSFIGVPQNIIRTYNGTPLGGGEEVLLIVPTNEAAINTKEMNEVHP